MIAANGFSAACKPSIIFFVIALALFYWIHLLATIAWLGGLLALTWVSLTQPSEFMESVERTLRPVGLAAAAALLVTGMIQMGANDSYLGFLRIDNIWSAAMLAKHVLFAGMLILTAYAQWQVSPSLERLKLLNDQSAIDQQRHQLKYLVYINLGLGIAILLLTAIMTAATT